MKGLSKLGKWMHCKMVDRPPPFGPSQFSPDSTTPTLPGWTRVRPAG